MKMYFVQVKYLNDGIIDLCFRDYDNYLHASSILSESDCTFVCYQAERDKYPHIFTNEKGFNVLQSFYE